MSDDEPIEVVAAFIETEIAKVQKRIERLREDAESKNFEIANGSKLMLKHAKKDLAILALARKGAAATLQPAMGDGWKMVPVEPDEEMVKQGFYRMPRLPGLRKEHVIDIYRAMLRVAPASPVMADRREVVEETLKFVYPSMMVLETMCKKAGLNLGAEQARQMREEMERVMPELPALSSLRNLSASPAVPSAGVALFGEGGPGLGDDTGEIP